MSIYFSAEIGSNHNQNKSRMYKLIDKAKEIGANSVKLQLFKAKKLWHPSWKEQFEVAKKRELPAVWIPEITDYCKKMDIQLGITPFDLGAVDVIKDFVDFIKISSYDILRMDLIEKCFNTGKRLVISTGEANISEIENVILKLREIGKYSKFLSIPFLHCYSSYPVKKENCDMSDITLLYTILRQYIYNPIVGYSDHSKDPDVIYEAYEKGANWVEFHLDLEDEEGCEGSGHCWRPNDIQVVIEEIRQREEELKYKRQLRADPSDGLRPCLELRNVGEINK